MLKKFLKRLAKEPPFRVVARAMMKYIKVSVETRSIWEVSERPPYLIGLVEAAKQAKQQGQTAISAIEFGVAGGSGLVALQNEAAAVEKETGVEIRVYGFDMGAAGLPDFIGDFRDHPDAWMPGDYRMDEEKLKASLAERTTLILGNVSETVAAFFKTYNPPPVGFVSFDLDLYSSTKEALGLFKAEGLKMLWNTPIYFDDIEFVFNHKWAGELLAIDEFNQENQNIKIDRWYGVEAWRPFAERHFYKQFYVAHNLKAISGARLNREEEILPL